MDYFGRAIVPPTAPGTGMSPLDMLPPDMPDTHEEDDFDEFGTFQVSIFLVVFTFINVKLIDTGWAY